MGEMMASVASYMAMVSEAGESTDPLERPILSNLLRQVGLQRTLTPDEVLIREGDVVKFLCLIVYGKLRATASSEDGRETLIRDFEPGDSLGDRRLLDAGPAAHRWNSTVRAVSNTTILLAPVEFIRFYVADSSTFWLEESRYLCHCGSKLRGRLLELAAPSLTQRLAQFLCGMAEANGDSGYVVNLSHEELSRAVRAHRCSVTRALQELSALSLITLGRRRILFDDLDNLRAFSPPTD